MKKSDIKNIIILLLTFIILILSITKFKYLYGSTLDWEDQHWVFPEYFRNLFYDTFHLFPSFAFNIGGGQNIYNFSYYGFLNPIILLSYVLPFIKMIDYIMIASMIGVGTSIILFYQWLRNNKFNSKLTFLVSFLFLCSSPLIFHSHRHIMFVSYIPFLLFGLLSIDKYFKTGKRASLILSVFLVIMSSYYFSIPSLVVFVIYGINCYLKKQEKFEIREFFQEGFKFLILLFIGILMAGILLLPTFYTILNGRSEETVSMSLQEILLPKINLQYLLYDTYSMGLTSIILFSLIYCITSKKKENRFMGVVIVLICLFPLFVYLLNGMLYVNAKVLIPFIPLCYYIIASFLQDLLEQEVKIIKICIATIIISILAYFTLKWNYMDYYIIDVTLMIIMLMIYYYKKLKITFILALISLSFANVVKVNMKDKLVSKENYEYIFNENIETLFDEVLSKEENIYRSSNLVDDLNTANKVYNNDYYNTSIYSSVYHTRYKDFYTKEFENPISHRNYLMLSQVNSILWNIYMGVKYVVTDKEPFIGYQKLQESEKFIIYQNEDVLPIGYARDNLMSKKEYESLEYPYNIEALLNYTVIDKEIQSNYASKIEKLNLNFNHTSIEGLNVEQENEHYKITVDKKTKIIIPLEKTIEDKLLLIGFKMNAKQLKEDTAITINGVKNVLTCSSWKYKNQNYDFHYVISSKNSFDKLEIEFEKGYYDISNIQMYVMEYKDVKSIKEQVDTFEIDKEKTKGDSMEGDITVTKNGYFSLSIPYDEGFKIYINDEEINYQLVNEAFIGFELPKGEYHIKLVYYAPWKNVGVILSGIGLVLFIMIGIRDKKL